MKDWLKRYYLVIILMLIFFAPGLAAIYFYQHPELLKSTGNNKGQLIKPAVQLIEPATKWHLIYWNPDVCQSQCEADLEKLAKIRLALGRKLYYVTLNLASSENVPVSEDLQARLKERDIEPISIVKKMPMLNNQRPHIFIANPDGFFILAFDVAANPRDIFHDLKLLVSQSENR